MQYALAALALAAAATAIPTPQTDASGCQTTYPGTFQITVVNTTESKRSLEARQASPVTITLTNGNITDSLGRVGYIASNNQFQFDTDGQAGAKTYNGWAICPGSVLTLNGEDVFTQCLSGEFYNLYTTNDAAQCNPIHILVLGGSTSGGSAPAQQSSDGQPIATQITDGQVQAPITQISDGQIQAPTGAPVTQIGDGQIQAPTGAPVTQIGDGQIQAPTGAPVTQIGDGQIQAPTGAPVTQISDGQIQAPTATGAPVTQIGDGQIQAPTGAPVTQIADGQIQAPTNGSVASPTPVPYTGSAVSVRGSVFGLFAGILAVALL